MVKICIFGLDYVVSNVTIKDKRIDQLKDIFQSAKKVYLQAELIDREKASQADGLMLTENVKLEIILADIDFIETRVGNCTDEAEKNLLLKLKAELEKEKFINEITLTDEEKKTIAVYPLLTAKPVFIIKDQTIDLSEMLLSAYAAFGFITFFTAGEKDSHAWSIKRGANAHEASGAIHSDIQKGFIKAEVLGFDDLIKAGSFNNARNQGLLRLEGKEYIVKDGDWITFRFNKS